MDVRESFVSNPAHAFDDANITLNHSCNESSATKGNGGGAQTDWLRDGSAVTTPSGHNSTKTGRCLCCANQCAEQNRNGDQHGDHAPCSLHRARPACDRTPGHRNVARDGRRAHRCSNPRCTALDSPQRAQTYPRYRCEQHSEQRSATSTMSHWTSASARMQTGPYHEGELEHSRINYSLIMCHFYLSSRMPNSQSREPGFESLLLPFRNLGIFVHFTTPQFTQLCN